jgi:hypothetical protein
LSEPGKRIPAQTEHNDGNQGDEASKHSAPAVLEIRNYHCHQSSLDRIGKGLGIGIKPKRAFIDSGIDSCKSDVAFMGRQYIGGKNLLQAKTRSSRQWADNSSVAHCLLLSAYCFQHLRESRSGPGLTSLIAICYTPAEHIGFKEEERDGPAGLLLALQLSCSR